MLLKIAIPIKDDKLAEELFDCESMLIYLIEDGIVVIKESRPLNGKTIDTLIGDLQEFGINLLITYHIREDVRVKLNNNRIGIICRSNHNADDIVEEYIKEITC